MKHIIVEIFMGGILSSGSRTFDFNDVDDAQREEVLIALYEHILNEYKNAEPGGYQVKATSQCYASNNRVIRNIPLACWRKGIRDMTKQPYVLTEVEVEGGTLMKMSFVMNSNNPPPSALLARAAVSAGLARTDICPITHDLLSECESYAVNNCGHVFSDAALKCGACPLCGAPAAWTFVKRGDVVGTAAKID